MNRIDAPAKLHPPVPNAQAVGWMHLADALGLNAPVERPCAVLDRRLSGGVRRQDAWRLYDRRYRPGDSWLDHLRFAVRHEGLHPLLLMRTLAKAPMRDLANALCASPNSAFLRRMWFFAECLAGVEVNAPDCQDRRLVPALDPNRHFALAKGAISARHRVRDNLLGTAALCPFVQKTPALSLADGSAIRGRLRRIAETDEGMLARAVAWLLLEDTKSSFALEGERPGRTVLEHWGAAVAAALDSGLTEEALLRMHDLLMGDARLPRSRGYRLEQAFIGRRDNAGRPVPAFAGALPEDVQPLCQGLLAANERMSEGDVPPIVQAACTSFGLVYIHPFEDGNGRMHRAVAQQVLARRGLAPQGVHLPLSKMLLHRVDAYRDVLQGHSAPLMRHIQWTPAPTGNIRVHGATRDMYAFFDATKEAELLFACVQEALLELPREIDHLRRRDEAAERIRDDCGLSAEEADLAISVALQNDGRISKRKRKRPPFDLLDGTGIQAVEDAVSDAFELSRTDASRPASPQPAED